MRLSEVYGGQAEDVRDALSAGPVVLFGVPGSCRAELTAELHPGSPRLELRSARAGTAAGLRFDTARALLRLIDKSSPGTSPREFRARLAELFGGNARLAVAAAEGARGSSMSFPKLVDGIPSQALVVVHDAHLLAEPWAERALWTLRARCQQRNSPRLILLTRPWHTSALTGRDAAFFGFGETFELTPPDLPRWLELTNYEIGTDDMAWLLEQTRGIPRPTLAAVKTLPASAGAGTGSGDVQASWAAHVEAQRGAAKWIDRLAHGLHPYGPRLLAAIAGSEPVYPSVPEARTDAIASALRAMRDHDLIYQPIRRRWVVADPALVSHLVGLSRPEEAAEPPA